MTPFFGSRMRAHTIVNILGQGFTQFYQSPTSPPDVREQAISSPWVATVRINAATGRTFSSWDEVSQHYTQKKDLFTITVCINLTLLCRLCLMPISHKRISPTLTTLYTLLGVQRVSEL